MPLLGQCRAGREWQRDRPATGVAADEPVRLHADRLVDQLEAAFGLADVSTGKAHRPVGRLIECQADVDAEPFATRLRSSHVIQIELPAQLAQSVPVPIVKIAVVGAGGQPGKLNSTAKVQRRSAGRFSSR